MAGVALAHLAVPILKDALERPRPPGELVEVEGYRGRAASAAYAIIYPWLALTLATWSVAELDICRHRVLIVAGALLAAAIGLSRVYLRTHYLSDVNSGPRSASRASRSAPPSRFVVAHFRNNAVSRE